MRRILKSTFTIMLAMLFLAMLPISSLAESTQATLTYDAEYFVKKDDWTTKALPEFLYNGNTGSNVSITGGYDSSEENIKQVYDFALESTVLQKNKNDVLEITDAKKTVTLSGNQAKYIGIIANTSVRNSVNTQFNVKFDDESTKAFDVTVESMFTKGTYSCGYGKSLTVNDPNALRKVYGTEADLVYFNLIELKTDSIKNVSSIEFCDASDNYHVIGVVEIPYTTTEIEEIKNQATGGLLPAYENKMLTDLLNDGISDTDIENLSKLVGALDPNHEKYEHIENLYNGCVLYPKQKEIKNSYDEIMAVKDYLNETPENISNTDVDNIIKLIELYETQKNSDRTTLEEVMDYFSITEDIFLDLSEQETIEALYEDYLVIKSNKELLDEIENLYNTYKDKTTAELSTADITILEGLIDKYDEADEKGLSYDEAEYQYIQKLLNDYPKYTVSENDHYYDLSAFFNKGFTAEGNETSIPDYWGTTDRFTVNGTTATYTTGMRKSVWDASHTNGIVVATAANFQKETSVIEPNPGNLPTSGEFKFKISKNSNITDKNVIELKGSSVVIPGSKRMAKNFNILSMVGTQSRLSTFEITLNYTDATSKIWKVGFPYNGWEQPAVVKLDDRIRPYVLDNKMVLSTQRTVSRAAVLPVEAGKIIDNVVIRGASATECILLAVTEEMLSNDEYKDVLLQQYNKVKDYDDNTFNKAEATKFSLYCEEGEKRGIDISKIVDIEKADRINKKVMTAENKFAKINENTVSSTLSFTQPINKEDLTKNLTVSKDGKITEDYKLTMPDEKTAVIEIKDELFGGVSYKVSVSEELPLRDYPTYTISNGYEFTYTSPAYMEATLSGKTLTVKNNTESDLEYVAVATSMNENSVHCNVSFEETLQALDSNSHTIDVVQDDLFVSIWDKNQKLLLNVVGKAQPTTSQTVSTADYMYPSLDFETNELKIAGITPSKEENKNITLDILKGNVSFIKKEAVTNKDGYFEIKVSLNETLIPIATTLSFTLGGDDFEEKVSLKSVYFSLERQREDLIDKLSKETENEIIRLLKQSSTKDILALDELVYNALDLDLAGKLVYANKNLFSVSDIPGSRDNLRRLLILEAFNQGKKDIIAKDGYLLYEDVMEYSSKIDTSNVTIYSLYNKLVSASGRDLTVASLLNKNFSNLDALISLMTENMLINELEYPNVSSVGYVSDVLTAGNTAKISLSIPKYFTISDKTSINTAIAGAVITTKGSIETVVNNFNVPSDLGDGNTTSSGGFSSGSSGASDLGIDQPSLDKLINQNNDKNGATAFKDVAKNHWAYSFINELYEKKILSGKGDGTFAPEDSLTRAELVKIIVTAKGLEAQDGELPFTDVTSDSWYMPYVKAAYSNGIITGVSDTDFAPNEKISRQDLCVVLYRLLADKRAGEINFKDANTIAPYALDAVKCFVNLGIINGFEDGSFRANDGCTRAQCAKIISMFLQK